MQRRTVGVAVAVATTALAGTMLGGPAEASDDGWAIGLTTKQELVTFDVDRPGAVDRIGKVSGLRGDDKIVGIDYRVQDRKLYGVGDQGGVYTLSTRTGAATKAAQLDVELDGMRFGVDFNPAADALRIVSDTGQNLRHSFVDGTTTADGTLTYPATATTPAVTATGVTGAGYTNNDLDATTATTLFVLDTALDQVVIQAPANAGLLSPTGKFGVDAGANSGFDVYSKLSGGKTRSVAGYATLRVNDRFRLFRVSLLTGAVSMEGTFPQGWQVADLAVKLDG